MVGLATSKHPQYPAIYIRWSTITQNIDLCENNYADFAGEMPIRLKKEKKEEKKVLRFAVFCI